MRPLLIGAAALSLLLVPILSVEYFGGVDLANAAIQKAKSFVELIGQRSPGHRTQGKLVKTKRRIVKRHERALPKVQLAIPILPPIPSSLFELVAPPLAPKFASVDAMPIPPLAEQAPPPPGFTPPPGLIVPPTETPPFTPPPPPVPEPSSWASMLLGFALIGWVLRVGRRENIALVR